MTALGVMRAWRLFWVMWFVFSVVLLAQGAASGNLIGTVAPAGGAACCILTISLATKTIRRRAEQLRPRPDYAHIARMERDIFGETFEHDGAPQVSRPQRQTCGNGHPQAVTGACWVCGNRRRLDSPIPADAIRSIVLRDRSRDEEAIRSGYIVPRDAAVIMPSGEKITGAEWARRGGRTS
ncbi:MAG TPA: hypothetical protein VHZ03_30560 [Trebonia sp.]|jgi:hypothetical protein|nr:hypothetical protein [Trebonia sp.]